MKERAYVETTLAVWAMLSALFALGCRDPMLPSPPSSLGSVAGTWDLNYGGAGGVLVLQQRSDSVTAVGVLLSGTLSASGHMVLLGPYNRFDVQCDATYRTFSGTWTHALSGRGGGYSEVNVTGTKR